MWVKMGVSTSSVSITTMPVTKLARGVLALRQGGAWDAGTAMRALEGKQESGGSSGGSGGGNKHLPPLLKKRNSTGLSLASPHRRGVDQLTHHSSSSSSSHTKSFD